MVDVVLVECILYFYVGVDVDSVEKVLKFNG